MQATPLVGTIFAALGLLWTSVAIGHALLHKRRPQSAFGWIAVCVILPFAGPLLYYLFGVNRVRSRARRLMLGMTNPACEPFLTAAAPPGREPLERLGFAVSGLPLAGGNRVQLLHNGEAAFPAMLDAIAGARRRVFLSTYIFESGALGQRFVTALGAARARGVDVRVLLDGVGELYSWPPVRTLLERHGVRAARFLPPRLWPLGLSVNLRNHRKILAVDGCTAFAGGINIRDDYLVADAPHSHRIVDLHARFDGPVAAQIEAVFVHDWQVATGEAASPPPLPIDAAGDAICRAIVDGPEIEFDRLVELLVGAIANAKRRIAIMTPYFLPPRELIAPLQAAALQGVDVAVILPAHNNLPYVHRATRHMLWELLQRDVRVYYQPPPFVHSKIFYVDDDYAQLGSANLDPRSLRLNFEMNVEIYDRALVERLSAHFEDVRARSRQISLGEVDGRAFGTKLVDGAAWLFTPYL
jgi:cardiolipin synthase